MGGGATIRTVATVLGCVLAVTNGCVLHIKRGPGGIFPFPDSYLMISYGQEYVVKVERERSMLVVPDSPVHARERLHILVQEEFGVTSPRPHLPGGRASAFHVFLMPNHIRITNFIRRNAWVQLQPVFVNKVGTDPPRFWETGKLFVGFEDSLSAEELLTFAVQTGLSLERESVPPPNTYIFFDTGWTTSDRSTLEKALELHEFPGVIHNTPSFAGGMRVDT